MDMKRASVGLFCCYPLMPFAFFCGFGLLEARPYGMLAVLYYVLLLASLWGCRRFGGWVGRWYLLAFGIAWLHLFSVGTVLLNTLWKVSVDDTKDTFLGLVLLSILGVYLAACCAGSALAFRQNRRLEGAAQLLAPLLFFTANLFGVGGVILAYGGQGLHALFLSFRQVDQVSYEDLNTIGFSPEN